MALEKQPTPRKKRRKDIFDFLLMKCGNSMAGEACYPYDEYEKLSEKVELSLREKLICLIQEGQNVVIDFSFWNKENRNFYRQLIDNAGGTVELVYMKASLETLRKRLTKRNLHLNPNSPFIITDEILEHHYYGFQEPCNEGEIIIPQNNE